MRNDWSVIDSSSPILRPVMADVKGSKKRHPSTDDADNIKGLSPPKRLRSMEKEQQSEAKTPSPAKERKSKASKDKTSNSKTVKSPTKGKGSNVKQFLTPSPTKERSSSPLVTPKTPKAASKIGIPAEVAKIMLKYASRLNPLVGMMYSVTQHFVEQNEDMPSRQEFLPKLIDCVNSLVSPILFQSLTSRIRYYSTESHFQL